MKIDWKRKLSSRKFWSLLTGFISALLIAFRVSESTIVQVIAVISAFGLIAIYILAEASIDKASIKDKAK